MAKFNGKKVPDTNNPIHGQTPGQIVYAFLMTEDICPNCRARWTDSDSTHCANCDATITAYRARRARIKMKKDLKRPSMVELVITRDSTTNALQIAILSDVGTLLKVRGLEDFAIRDARRGKAHLSVFKKAA